MNATWKPIETAPKDGTEITAIIWRDAPNEVRAKWSDFHGQWMEYAGDNFWVAMEQQPNSWRERHKEGEDAS